MYQINVKLPVDGIYMEGELTLPVKAESLVIIVRGTGLYSEEVFKISRYLQRQGLGTLLYGLSREEQQEPKNLSLDLLTQRLIAITLWISSHSEYRSLGLAYLGSGVGAAASLKAAGELNSKIDAIVSWSGRTDLVRQDLTKIKVPTLLITGELDFHTVKINRNAMKHLNGSKQLVIVPGASHLFKEPGKLDHVMNDINHWLHKYLKAGDPGPGLAYGPAEIDADQ